MNRDSIGGRLGMNELQALVRADPRRHFKTLTHEQAVVAVRAMADSGQSETTIACATGWSVEYVKHVLGDRQKPL